MCSPNLVSEAHHAWAKELTSTEPMIPNLLQQHSLFQACRSVNLTEAGPWGHWSNFMFGAALCTVYSDAYCMILCGRSLFSEACSALLRVSSTELKEPRFRWQDRG